MLRFDKLRITQGPFSLVADFSIDAGSFVGVIGPSGAGKSTLLSAIAGFTPLAGGSIVWNGERVDQSPPASRPVAMLFQDNNLFPHLSIERNVGLALSSKSLAPSERARVHDALAQVGLEGFADRKPGTLSGGQQSRAALARILLQNKPLVLLDEPFSALGPGQRAEMMDLCRSVLGAAGRTVLIVTHDPVDAARTDQLVLVLGQRAEAPVASKELLADPPEALRAYLGK